MTRNAAALRRIIANLGRSDHAAQVVSLSANTFPRHASTSTTHREPGINPKYASSERPARRSEYHDNLTTALLTSIAIHLDQPKRSRTIVDRDSGKAEKRRVKEEALAQVEATRDHESAQLVESQTVPKEVDEWTLAKVQVNDSANVALRDRKEDVTFFDDEVRLFDVGPGPRSRTPYARNTADYVAHRRPGPSVLYEEAKPLRETKGDSIKIQDSPHSSTPVEHADRDFMKRVDQSESASIQYVQKDAPARQDSAPLLELKIEASRHEVVNAEQDRRNKLGRTQHRGPNLRPTHMSRAALDRFKAEPGLKLGQQTRDEAALWIDTFDKLKSMTSSDSKEHTTSQETVYPPSGYALSWTGNPGEAILRVLQMTGSALQMGPSERELGAKGAHFSSFVLTGTPSQNDAALHCIESWRDLSLVAEGSQDPQHISLNQLEKKRTSLTKNVNLTVTRTRPPQSGFELSSLIEAARQGIVLPPLQLSVAVNMLTAKPTTNRELAESRRRSGAHSIVDLMADALQKLMCNPANVPSTMTESLGLAWGFLNRHGDYGRIRAIQAAHDDFHETAQHKYIRADGTRAWNEQLRSAALGQQFAQFASLVESMRSRKLRADSGSWLHFMDLTQRCEAGKMAEVLATMENFGMLSLPETRQDLMRLQLDTRLRQAIEANTQQGHELPPDFVADFVEGMTREYDNRWLDPLSAQKMIDVLLELGHWRAALQVCDASLSQNYRIKLQLLHRLLEGAALEAAGSADRALHVIQHLSDHIARPWEHKHKVQERKRLIFLNKHTFELLFNIAIAGRSWNLARVVWQHACCSGTVSSDMLQKMHFSLAQRAITRWHTYLELGPSKFFARSFAIFAVGVGTHRDPKQPGETNLFRQANHARDVVMKRDLAAYGQVVPIHSLASDASTARADDIYMRRLNKILPNAVQRPASCVWPYADWADLARNAMSIPIRSLTRAEKRLSNARGYSVQSDTQDASAKAAVPA